MKNRPKPTLLKIMRGNPGRRPLNKREPIPLGDLKEPPAHFNEQEREVWNYAVENAPPGLLRKLDASVLEAWCAAHVVHRQALIELRKTGLIVKAPNTKLPIQSPFLPIVNKQALIMLRAVDHLGFSPASRTRIQLGEGAGSATGWDEIATG